MSNKLKRVIACLATIIMLLCSVPMGNFAGVDFGFTVSAEGEATSGQCGDNVYWTLDDDGTLTISGEGEMWNYGYYGGNISPFYENSGIKNVVIENGVTSIGDFIFYWCFFIEGIEIPNSIITIGDCSFEYCNSLKYITIPDSVTSIGDYALLDCCNLVNIDVTEGNANYSSMDGVLFNKDKTQLIQYPRGKELTEYIIENSVTTIGEFAFGYCENLKSVIMANSVTKIGNSSFYNCYNLTNIEISNNVKTIGALAFGGCTRLSNVTIPRSVISIGDYAFTDNPLVATRMDTILNIYYSGSKSEWEKILLGEEAFSEKATIHFSESTHTHNYTPKTTKAATCTSTGTKTYTCSCGDTYTETIAKTAHTPVTDKAVSATCTTAGKTVGSHCSECGTVIKAQTTVKARGHKTKTTT
ncbi:MAG: leucine-rich repeat domain-containing protein, partial [Ruminococcus sp.]|nr:leucine-rich repeat domain-containing protein [Ruminococcus sp.]